MATATRSHIDWHALSRAIGTLLFVSAVGVAAGWVLSFWLEYAPKTPFVQQITKVGPAFLTLSGVIAHFEKLLKLGKTLWDYVRVPAKSISIYPDCASLGLVAAALTISYLTLTGAPSSTLQPPPVLVQLTPAGDSNTVLYAAGFALGKADLLADGDIKDKESLLRKLAATMKACSDPGGGYAVSVRVEGFADANEYDNDPGERKNLDLAHRRADRLTQLIQDALALESLGNAVTVLPRVQWASSRQMRTHPHALGGRPSNETLGVDQGQFNRRANVVLVNPGLCARLIPKMDDRLAALR